MNPYDEPVEPTATQVLFLNVTPLRVFDVPEVFEVQFIPSDDVRIVPEPPTAKKVLFP